MFKAPSWLGASGVTDGRWVEVMTLCCRRGTSACRCPAVLRVLTTRPMKASTKNPSQLKKRNSYNEPLSGKDGVDVGGSDCSSRRPLNSCDAFLSCDLFIKNGCTSTDRESCRKCGAVICECFLCVIGMGTLCLSSVSLCFEAAFVLEL